MQNKIVRRMAALGVCSTLVISSMFVGNNTGVSKADEDKSVTSTKTTTDNSKTAVEDTSKTNRKSETVYVMANADGTVKNTIVSNWLENLTNSSILVDQSDLSNIVNVKGDETYSQDGSKVTWTTDGGDIYYQGTTTKEVPVGVKVTYTLDGKEVAADELDGKTGKLSIQFDYTNTTATDTESCVPFTVVLAALVDTDKMTNLEVENAKVVSDGDKMVVVGVAFPGIRDLLDLSDIDIPESITITGDVTDYKALTFYNVVTADLLTDLDLEDQEIFTKLEDSLTDLSDASQKLVNGTSEFYDAMTTLDSSTGKYMDGVNEFNTKLQTYFDGVDQLAAGIQTLSDKTPALVSGVETLDSGMGSVKSAVDQFVAGVSAVDVSSFSTQFTKLQAAIKTLSDAKQKENALYDSLSQTITANEQILAVLKQTGANDQAVASLTQTIATQKQIVAGLKQYGAGISTGLTQMDTQVKSAGKEITSLSNTLTTMTTKLKQLQAACKQLKSGTSTLLTSSKTLKSGVSDLNTAAKKIAGYNSSFLDGGSSLVTNGQKLKQGVSDATDASKTMKESMAKFDKEGIQELVNKYDEIKDSVEDASTIFDNAKEYTSFTGVSDGWDSSLKFIYKIN